VREKSKATEDVGWDTRERIARRYGLVKRFAGKRGNGELDGGEGGVNGACLMGQARKVRERPFWKV
jgi:hypothetical protein